MNDKKAFHSKWKKQKHGQNKELFQDTYMKTAALWVHISYLIPSASFEL